MNPTLYLAAASGDVATLESFSFYELLGQKTPQNNTVLHVAVLHKRQHAVEKILQSHGWLLYDQQNSDGDTSLHLAAEIGSVDIAKVLIDHEKNTARMVNQKLTRMVNQKEDSALHVAVQNGHFSVVELLAEEDSELACLRNRAGESPLFQAVERKSFDIATHLLTRKCSLAGRNGMNALHAAVAHLYEATNSSGNESEQHGVHNSNLLHGIVNEILRTYSSALQKEDNLEWTPLHYAAHFGLKEVIELFLNSDKSPAYKRDKEGMSAFHIATKNGDTEIMERISTICPDVFELLTLNDQTALHVAVRSGKKGVVECLLRILPRDNLLIINKQDKDGNTPLHLASISEEYEILVMLLNDERVSGIDLNNDGLTALDIIQSSKKLQESQKVYIKLKLEIVGGFHSLKQHVIDRNIQLEAEHNIETENDEGNERLEVKKKSAGSDAQTELLIATLIASVTFALAYQVPGGYESNGPFIGLPILRHKTLFKVFIIFDALTFGLSSSTIFFYFTKTAPIFPDFVRRTSFFRKYMSFFDHMGKKFGLEALDPDKELSDFNQVQSMVIFYSILLMVVTFIIAIYLVSGNSQGIKAAGHVCAAVFSCFIGRTIFIFLQ